MKRKALLDLATACALLETLNLGMAKLALHGQATDDSERYRKLTAAMLALVTAQGDSK